MYFFCRSMPITFDAPKSKPAAPAAIFFDLAGEHCPHPRPSPPE
jgi:hypothetical protein